MGERTLASATQSGQIGYASMMGASGEHLALGLKFRGRMAWPIFRSYVPGCMPWFVTPGEARFLIVAIEQSLDVTRRLDDDPGLLEPPEKGQYLVRVQAGQGWADEWLVPEPVEVRPLPAVDTKRLTALRQQLPRRRINDLLTPIAAGLGIRLKISRRMRSLDEARTALVAWMG